MLARLKNFRFDWKLSLFTLLLLPLLIRLGFWQLEREQEKLALQSLYESRQGAQTVELASVNPGDDLQYVPVHFTGSYNAEHNFLLDNKIYEGQVGFEVLTPFYTENAQLVLVNRGWIPQNTYRENLPELESVNGQVRLNGAIYVPAGEQFMLGEDAPTESWPRIIQSIDMDNITRALETDIEFFPYTVRLGAFEPGVYVRNWTVISTTPERHRGYAVQWFSMAAVLLLLYGWISTRKEREGETVFGEE